MKYIRCKYANGNTGCYINEPGVGWKYVHGNAVGHHLPSRDGYLLIYL
ncbi:hypothetical protein [Bacillus thuringiensis]